MAEALVIFDCDGVLVDSEPISINLMRNHCLVSGVELTEEDAYRAFLGRPVADAHQNVLSFFGRQIMPIDLAEFQKQVLDAFEKELRAVPGIENALAKIDAPVCVASSSNLARIERSLKLANLSRAFGPNLFSTDMVKRGKPHPDVFLHAAAVMGYEPHQSIVVEDSPAGLEAAKAAGMKAIAFCGGSHATSARLAEVLREYDPDILIEHMRDLPSAVQRLS